MGRKLIEFFQTSLWQGCNYQQDHGRPCVSRPNYLLFIHNEIFVEGGDTHLTRYFPEILDTALEKHFIGQDRNHHGPIFFVSLSLRDDIHINMNISQTRAGLFHFRDDLKLFWMTL